MILITGGAGFIGSHFSDLVLATGEECVILDAMTYAGSMLNVPSDAIFSLGDINNKPLVRGLIEQYNPRAVVHFAAESHVERSFAFPDGFIHTNVHGTLQILDALREHKTHFGECPFLVHVSTDEVYGSVTIPAFENTRLRPGNPYSASKAAAESFVSAYRNTHSIPSMIVRLSNVFGPRQFPEKLIPVAIRSALQGNPIVIHGDGGHMRQWIYVAEACDGIWRVLTEGIDGDIYNIAGNTRMSTSQVASSIISEIGNGSTIAYTPDRPGNDRSYWMSDSKARTDLHWGAHLPFIDGLRATIDWIKQ